MTTNVILAPSLAAATLSPNRKTPYTDDRQLIGQCCGGWGMYAYATQRLATDALPYRQQKFGMVTDFGATNDVVAIPPQEIPLLSVGFGSPGATLQLPFPTIDANLGDIQARGSFFNRYCFLLIGLSFKPDGLVQLIGGAGAFAGSVFSPDATIDAGSNPKESRLYNQAAAYTSVNANTADEECIARLGVMDMWPDSTGFGNKLNVTRGGGADGMMRDFLIFNQAMVVGGLDNDQLAMQISLLHTLVVSNSAPVPLLPTATIGGVAATPLGDPVLIFTAKFWGFAICCPVIADCPVV